MMISFSTLLGLSVFIALIIIWYKGIKRKYSISRLFLTSTLFLFSITLLLLIGIFLLEEANKEVVVCNQNINNEVLYFALWYYQVPAYFLILTIIAFLQKGIKKR